MVFITEGFFEVAIERWPKWDLYIYIYIYIYILHDELAWPYTFKAIDHLILQLKLLF